MPTLEKDAIWAFGEAAQFSKGYADVSTTGSYGYGTMKVVKDMRQLHGLQPAGNLDSSMWCAIVGGCVREAFGR